MPAVRSVFLVITVRQVQIRVYLFFLCRIHVSVHFAVCLGCKTILFHLITVVCRGSWLRHCATSRKVAGSIPDGVIGIFSLT